MKIFQIKDFSYFRDVFFICDFTPEQITRYWKRRGCENFRWNQGTAGRWLVLEDGLTHYVMVADGDTSPWTTATLGHEVMHLTFHVLRHAGVRYRRESEEAFTYYFQWIFSRCMHALTRHEKRLRRAKH